MVSGAIPLNPRLITISPRNMASNTVYADVIQVQWQDSDQTILELMSEKSARETQVSGASNAASPASRTTMEANATAASATITAATATPEFPSSVPSSGAKIAMGIVIPVVVTALVAAVAFLVLRRRKRAKKQSDPTQGLRVPGFHELDQNEVGQSAPAEMDAREMGEMPATMVPIELPGRGISQKTHKQQRDVFHP